MARVLKSLTFVGLCALLLGLVACSSSPTPTLSAPTITNSPITTPGSPEDPNTAAKQN